MNNTMHPVNNNVLRLVDMDDTLELRLKTPAPMQFFIRLIQDVKKDALPFVICFRIGGDAMDAPFSV
jgi:hypothetical protein